VALADQFAEMKCPRNSPTIADSADRHDELQLRSCAIAQISLPIGVVARSRQGGDDGDRADRRLEIRLPRLALSAD